MNYCYARVSTIEQHLDRQIAAFEPFKPYTLFTDKESGKDFDRTNYQKMKGKLRGGDLLIVSSLDRFGRNYALIKKEWLRFKNKGVKIKVIDMPLLDTSSDDLIAKLISDIVLNLLSYVAQTERENLVKRVREGMEQAKLRGVKMGRPHLKVPPNFFKVAERFLKHEITSEKASEILGLSRATFFRWLNEPNIKQYIKE